MHSGGLKDEAAVGSGGGPIAPVADRGAGQRLPVIGQYGSVDLHNATVATIEYWLQNNQP
jgi:hypothetical protein